MDGVKARLSTQITNPSLQEPSTMHMNQPSLANTHGNPIIPPHSISNTLTEALQSNSRLLSPLEKVAGQLQDPIIDHLYQSKTFVRFMIYICTGLLAAVVQILGIGMIDRLFIVGISIPSVILGTLVTFPLLFLPWSKRLR